MTDSIPSGYRPLTRDTLPGYLSSRLIPSCEPGGLPEEQKISEVGDRNLNIMFTVEGTHKTIVVKQALPWLRAGDEGRPLSLSRADFEYNALYQEAKYTDHTLIPQVCFYNPEMALFAMGHLAPHMILHKELIDSKKFPEPTEDISRFLVQILFDASDIGMSAEQKRTLTAEFALNHKLCKITEDLIFTEPYYNAERDDRTSPELDDTVHRTWADVEMIQVTMRCEYKFMTEAQALLHGDLHSSSIMVTDTDTGVIGPEFGSVGPMTFDIGNYIGSLPLTYFSRPGWDVNEQRCASYQGWLLQQIVQAWSAFTRELRQLWDNKTQGNVRPTEIYQQSRTALEDAQDQFFATLSEGSLVNAGMEINRRIIGPADAAELKQTENTELHAGCERRVLAMARDLIANAHQLRNMNSVIQFAKVK